MLSTGRRLQRIFTEIIKMTRVYIQVKVYKPSDTE